jgi:putative protease
VLEGLIHTWRGRSIPLIYRSDFCLVPARSHPLTRENLEQQLKKTGGTPFAIRNFSLEYSGDLFTPLAGLNRVRRELLARAEEMMIAHSHPPQECVEQAQLRWNVLKPEVIIRPPETSETLPLSSLVLGVCTDSLLSVEKAAEAGCDFICFEPVFTPSGGNCRIPAGFPSFASQTITASRICREAGIRFVLKFPRITDNNYLDSVLPLLSQTLSPEIVEVMVENRGTAQALMQCLPASVLFGSIGLNIFNQEAVRHIPSRFGSVTLSPELSRDEIRLLIHGARLRGSLPSFALIVQGSIEAMVSENCILQPWLPCNRKAGDTDTSGFFGIMDATGHTFPVRIDGECRSHIYNSAEICLIDHLPSLMQIGISEVLIDARGRIGTYTMDMIHLYQEAILLTEKGVPAHDPHFRYLKDAVKRLAVGGITTGHFVRGLQES